MLIVTDNQCKLCVLYLTIQDHGGLCIGEQTLVVNASPGLQTTLQVGGLGPYTDEMR